MKRLTKEQVQFIDNYLYNAGVHYIDVRCEMTDHVASALEEKEGDFGQNFFAFMAANKRDLMASNKSFKSDAFAKAWNMFLGNYKKPVFLLGTAVFMALSFLMAGVVGYDDVSNAFLIAHVVIYGCFYFSWIYFWVFKKNRYSVIDRLLIISFFLPMFFRLGEIITNKTATLVFYSLYTSLIVAMLFTIIRFHKRYKLRFTNE